jgi:hypothetical protein
MHAVLPKAGLKNALKRGVPKATIEWVKEALWTDVEKPIPNEKVVARVREYLRDDVQQVRAFSGKKFQSWSI